MYFDLYNYICNNTHFITNVLHVKKVLSNYISGQFVFLDYFLSTCRCIKRNIYINFWGFQQSFNLLSQLTSHVTRKVGSFVHNRTKESRNKIFTKLNIEEFSHS